MVDLNENGLAELTRDLRSTEGMYVPGDFVTYTMDFDSKVFRRIFREEGGFDIVANFSAHKHVRSEKDRNSVQALLENNVVKAAGLLGFSHRILRDISSVSQPTRLLTLSISWVRASG